MAWVLFYRPVTAWVQWTVRHRNGQLFLDVCLLKPKGERSSHLIMARELHTVAGINTGGRAPLCTHRKASRLPQFLKRLQSM